MDYGSLSSNQLVQDCLRAGNDDAWEEFLNRFHSLIATVVARTARRWSVTAPTTLEDLVQEVYLKLCSDHCRLLRDYHGIHEESLFAYLKVTAAHLVHDHFKARLALKRGSGCIDQSLDHTDPPDRTGGPGTCEEVERTVLLKQICALLSEEGYSRAHRSLFWLYYRQGYTASALAAIPAVDLTVKGVESLLLRMTRSVRDRLIAGDEGQESRPPIAPPGRTLNETRVWQNLAIRRGIVVVRETTASRAPLAAARASSRASFGCAQS
jgi:RNA polymerase sigma-70 factor, ECF subfamily